MFLARCLNHGFTMLDLFQNVADGFGSHERLGVLVIEPNERVDGRATNSGTLVKAPRRMRLRVISQTTARQGSATRHSSG
jgi:hypothetical protein